MFGWILLRSRLWILFYPAWSPGPAWRWTPGHRRLPPLPPPPVSVCSSRSQAHCVRQVIVILLYIVKSPLWVLKIA